MKYELKRLHFWELIGKSITLYLNNFLIFLLLVAICNVPYYVLQYTASRLNIWDGFAEVILYLLFLAGQALAAGLAIKILANRYLGEQIYFSEYIKFALSKVFPIIGLTIVLMLILNLGILLLVIPFFIWLACYSVAIPALVIENLGVFKAMKRSWELTKGARWWILGLIVVTFIMAQLITEGISRVLNMVISSLLEYSVLIFVISKALPTMILSPILMVVIILIYFNLRIQKEGFAVEHLSKQFSMPSQNYSLPEDKGNQNKI